MYDSVHTCLYVAFYFVNCISSNAYAEIEFERQVEVHFACEELELEGRKETRQLVDEPGDHEAVQGRAWGQGYVTRTSLLVNKNSRY